MATPNIANVTIISLLFFLIFGIIGVNYFKGTYYDCYTSHLADNPAFEEIVSNLTHKWDCMDAGGVWGTKKFHFDDIFSSMITLFHMATVVGWAEVMYLGMSTTTVDYTMVYKNRPLWAFFFICFIIIGAFFILNLFVGVVISTFNREKESLGKNFLLTEKQKEWLDMKLLMFRSKPKKMVKQHKNQIRNTFLQISNHPSFDVIIMVCIILNTLVLMLKWYDQPQSVTDLTEGLNYMFAGIFTMEAMIKIFAHGKTYFKDGWNLFDFVIVIGTFVGIIISQTTTVEVGPSTTIVRSFRIFRVFRLVKRAKSLKLMFTTFIVTLPALANVGGLLMLLLYLYSILGMYLFSEVKI